MKGLKQVIKYTFLAVGISRSPQLYYAVAHGCIVSFFVKLKSMSEKQINDAILKMSPNTNYQN